MNTSTHIKINTDTDVFEVRQDPQSGFKALFACRSFEAGEALIRFRIKYLRSTPTYLTVQMDEKSHFEFDPEFLQYMNHHCDPNVHLNLEEFSLVALKSIEAGEELHFFYPSTEWKMDRPFECHCGAKNCLGLISGAHTLSTTQLSNYQLSPYIQQKLTN